MGNSSSKQIVPTPAAPPRDAKRVKAAHDHLDDSVRQQLQALGDQMSGQVLLAPPSDDNTGAEENDEMAAANAYHAQRERPFYFNDCNYPAAIIVPETIDDVVAAMTVIQKIRNENDNANKYNLSIACGCHSAYGMVDQAICLDLCKIKSVKVDLDAKLITIAGGCKIQDAHDALRGTGFGFVTGTNPDTGVSGLTLAGGAGYLGPQAGFAIDTVTQAKVVLASGKLVMATDDNEYQDLLRALRGGGGNFGVVVEWTFQLYDVRHAIGGVVVHMAPTVSSVKKCLANYVSIWYNNDPAPPDAAEGMWVLPCGAPVFLNVLSMIGDEVKDAKTYRDIQFLVKASKLGAWFRPEVSLARKDYITEIAPQLEPFQQRSYSMAIGAMVYSFDQAMQDALVHFSRVDYPRKVHSKSGILSMNLAGEMRRHDPSRSSLRHRNAVVWIIIEAAWEPQATEEEIKIIKDWAYRAKARIIELGGEDGPHNFADSDGRRIKFFCDEQRDFLETAKNKYDPTNLFRLNKNITAHTE